MPGYKPRNVISPIDGSSWGPFPTLFSLRNRLMPLGWQQVDIGPGWVMAGPNQQILRYDDGKPWFLGKDTGHGGVFGDIIDNREVIALVATIFTAGLSAPAAAGSEGSTLVQLSGPGAEAGPVTVSSTTATVTAGGAALANSASNLIDQSSGTANTVVEQLSGPIDDTITQSGNKASELLGTSGSSVSDLITDAKAQLSDIITPVNDFVHSVTGFVNDINSNIIQPILGPIKSTIDTVNTLVKVLHADLQSGIKGILNIPGDVARAFNSIDATVQRSVAMLSAAQEVSNRRALGEVFVSSGGVTTGDAVGKISAALAPAIGTFDAPRHFQLEEGIDLAAYKAKIRADQEEIAQGEGLAASLVQWVVRSAASLEAVLIQREPYNELWREEVARAFAIKRFDVGTVLSLLQRGELDATEATEELRVQGYSASRAAALIEQARTLPDAGKAQSLFARRWIDNTAAEAMLRAQGWSDSDARLLLDSSQTELGVDQLLELLRRGLIEEGETAGAIERQGIRQRDTGLLLASRWRLLGLADVMQLHDRLTARGAGGAFASLTADAPDELKSYAAKLGIDAGSARVLWSNHWRLLSPELACVAFFREYINAEQLDSVLAQASIPPELRQNFIDLQRPVIPFRTIGALLNHGIVQQSEALDILRSRGFTDRDAAWLMQSALATAKPSQAAHSTELHGLSKNTVLAMYDSGTVDREGAHESLTALGLSEHAVDAELSLHDARAAHADRLAAIDDIIALARAGQLELSEAQAELAALGLTAAELTKAQSKLGRTVRSGVKMPSDAQLLAMYKKGLLEREAALDALQLSGYSAEWAELLLQLEVTHAPRPQKP